MRPLLWLNLAICLLTVRLHPAAAGEPARPNILWITCEDTGPQLGCYGDRYAETPNLDQLAARSMRYLHAWSNAPVCAPARTTIITGVYPTSLGAEHMRSQVPLPSVHEDVPAVPAGTGLLLHEQQQGGLQRRQARHGVGRIVGQGPLEEPPARSAVLCDLQHHGQPREPDPRPAPHAEARPGQGPRAGLPPGHARDAARLGPVLRQGHRDGRPGWKAAARVGRGRAGGGYHHLLLRRPRLRHAPQQTLAVQLGAARPADRPRAAQAP